MSDVKKSEIARALDVDPAMITRWARRGMPLYSTEAASAWRAQHIRPRLAIRNGAAPNGSGPLQTPGSAMHDARLRREVAEASFAERRLQEAEGDLCRVADVRSAAKNVAAALARSHSDMPHRLAPQLVGRTQAEIHRALDGWQRDCRTQVAAECRRHWEVEIPS